MPASGSGPGMPPALAFTEFLCIRRMRWCSKKRVRDSRIVLDAAGHGALQDFQGIVLWAETGNGRLSSSRSRRTVPLQRRTPAHGRRPARRGNCSPTLPEQAAFRRSRPCCRRGLNPPPCTPAPAPFPRNGRWTAGNQAPACAESVRKSPSPPGRAPLAGYGAPAVP